MSLVILLSVTRHDARNIQHVVDPACWTDSVVGYNLSRDRRSHDGTTAKIHRKIQDRGCP
jgi:hypothetical protein